MTMLRNVWELHAGLGLAAGAGRRSSFMYALGYTFWPRAFGWKKPSLWLKSLTDVELKAWPTHEQVLPLSRAWPVNHGIASTYSTRAPVVLLAAWMFALITLFRLSTTWFIQA